MTEAVEIRRVSGVPVTSGSGSFGLLLLLPGGAHVVNLSSRIKACWAELAGVLKHAPDDQQLLQDMKRWVSERLVRVSKKLSSMVGGSPTLQMFLRCPPDEVPVTRCDLELLTRALSKPSKTANERLFLREIEAHFHRILFYYFDICPGCQYARYLVWHEPSERILLSCPLCGETPTDVTSAGAEESGDYVEGTTTFLRKSAIVNLRMWDYDHDPEAV